MRVSFCNTFFDMPINLMFGNGVFGMDFIPVEIQGENFFSQSDNAGMGTGEFQTQIISLKTFYRFVKG